MFKLNTFFSALLLLYLQSSLANVPNLQLNICGNAVQCGPLLIGAAHIDFNAIQWQGGSNPGNSLVLEISGPGFGFTGRSIYFREPGEQNPNNEWIFNSFLNVSKYQPTTGNAIHHFFAPTQVGLITASETHSTATAIQSFDLKGEGLADHESAPAITLDISTQLNNQPICIDGNYCDLYLPAKGKTIFTVTPRVDTTRLPEGQNINYVLVKLEVDEINVRCTQDGLTFRDTGQNNSFEAGNYYHHLENTGPNYPAGSCKRSYPFLISVGKSFWFQALNTRSTGTGYAQYHFSVNGHADAANLNRWPGSQKLFRLSTSAPQTPPPVASFTATPTSGTPPFTVLLDATASKNAQTFAWTSSGGQTIGGYAQTAVEFPAGTLPGKYTLTLTVTNSAGQSNSIPQTITVVSSNTPVDTTPAPIARFTATPTSGTPPFTVLLDATASQNAQTFTWESTGGQTIGKYAQTAVEFSADTLPGPHILTLIVTNSAGQPDRTSQTITLQPSPTARLDFSITPTQILTNSEVTLSLSATVPVQNPQWSILGPDTGTEQFKLQDLNSPLTSVIFYEAGEYSISLSAWTEDKIHLVADPKTILVKDSLPIHAQFTASPTSGFAPLTVHLDATASTPTTQSVLTNYLWNSTDSEQNNVHENSGAHTSMTFEEAGTYDITLTVQDDLAQTNSVTQTITVLPADLEFPSLNDANGDAQIFDLQNNLKSFSGANFEGGVLREATVDNAITFNSTEPVNIVARIRPHKDDLNTPIELLMIVYYTPPGGSGNWYMKNQSTVFPYQLWDGNVSLDNPTRFEYLDPAPEFYNLILFSGQFLHAEGKYTLYLGYRRPTSGEIIFNTQLLEFTVTP